MKNFTRIVCAVLALTFCLLCATACGEANYTANNTTYVIGATGPLTGDASVYGVAVQRGAMLAIEEINNAGGLNGVLFSFEMVDDMAAADKAATGYTSLFEKGMQASIGSVTSGSCASFAAEAEGDGVLFITPSASAENVIETGDNAFRVCFGDAQQGTLAADQLVATYSKIGVIYDTSDPYSTGLYEAFEAQMTKLNKVKDTDYFVYSFTKETNKDFSTQVSELKAKGCDVLFLPFYYTEAALVCKKAAQLDFNVPVFGCDGLDGIKDQLDDTVTAQVSYITPFNVESPDADIKAFVEAFEKKYGEAPNQFAADGYDAVMIIYEAMKAAGVNDVKISAADLAELLRPVLTGGTFKYDGLTGKGMTWTVEGSCEKDPQVVIVDRD